MKPKVIAKGEPDRAASINVLLLLGLWDGMPPDERRAFCEDGEVWDTPSGQTLLEVINKAKEKTS